MAEKCDVPLCLAVPRAGYRTCELHRLAAQAKRLGIVKRRCEDCRRNFAPADCVFKEATDGAYRHVRCEPTTEHVSAAERRDASKPLLEIADDTERNRGAA